MMPSENHDAQACRRRAFTPAFGWARTLTLACLALLGACSSHLEDGPSPEGELFAGEFEYICVNGNDAFEPCKDEQAFPDTVAVGSEFRLLFKHAGQTRDSAAQGPRSVRLASASDSKLFQLGPDHFFVADPGPVAVLALTPGQSSQAIDFLHIHAKRVDSLGVRTKLGNEDLKELRLVPGQPRELVARPYAAGTRQMMAGSLDYKWSSSDRRILDIVTHPLSRSVGIIARSQGVAVLTVTQDEISRSIDVIVETVPAQKDKDKEDATW